MKLTYVNDYVEQVHEKFPELTEAEVKRILVYGWKMILLYVSFGNDFSIFTHELFFFIGKLYKDSLKSFENYAKKLSRRIGYMFRRTNSEWDGYYYFTRSENQYKEYLTQNKRKYKIFKNVVLYRLLEELRVRDYRSPYIFRLDEDRGKHMHKFYSEIKTDKAELILIRDCMNMGDLMTAYNKFKYLQL